MGNIQIYDIQIIIPTLASESRFSSMKKAIKSVLSQEGMTVGVIVVVNGLKSYPPAILWLKDQNHIKYLYEEIGSAPLAHLKGRKNVDATFFGFLDDDDILLPGALKNRLNAMKNNGVDIIVENGWKKQGAMKSSIIKSIPACESDPQIELLRHNWMASCSALYRTETIKPEFFEDYGDYMEWTYVALKLTLNYRIKFINSFGFQVNVSTNSLSQSMEYSLGCIDTLKKMIAISPNKTVSSTLKRKMANTYHELFNKMLSDGDKFKATIFYFRCLRSFYGWRYLFNFRFLFIGRHEKKKFFF